MNSSWLMDAGIFVVSFGTAFYVLGRLGRKQAAKAVKKADTKVRSAAEEREAARKSADLTIRQLGNEKLAVITGDLTTFMMRRRAANNACDYAVARNLRK